MATVNKRKVLSVKGKVQAIRPKKKIAVACQEFGLSNSTLQMICKSRTEIISTFDQNGSRIKRFRKSKRSEVDEVLLKWFKPERGDNVPVSGPLLMMIFVLPKL